MKNAPTLELLRSLSLKVIATFLSLFEGGIA